MSANLEAHVEGLVPFVHVRDVRSSAEFYALLGFEVRYTYDVDGHRDWCWLERNQARLMLTAGPALVAAAQGVLFYVYVHGLEEVHQRLAAAGRAPEPIGPGAPGPDREFRVFDPDGYCVMVTDAAALPARAQ